MISKIPISQRMLNRLTRYLYYLQHLTDAPANISATTIAQALELNDVQVRKDLATVSGAGKPKIGYIREDLIRDIEHFLGYDDHFEAVLVGAGNLGKALISYSNFQEYGLTITAVFDSNPALINQEIGGKVVLDTQKIQNMCERMNIKIGIITVPNVYAQEVCNALIAGGVRAIWNFAPFNLVTPENVVVKNEDMAASWAVLTKQLQESIQKYDS